MAKLSYRKRKNLPKTSFAIPKDKAYSVKAIVKKKSPKKKK